MTTIRRFFLDTEFMENGTTIDLISIAVVADNGAEFYKVSTEARLDLVSPWVREHVLPSLPRYSPPNIHPQEQVWMPRERIASHLNQFVHDQLTDTIVPHKAEFWAYYADYDWVALCQLFGSMMQLPKHFPRYCMDLKQLSVDVGSPVHPKQDVGEHNALADAHWNVRLYNFLQDQKRRLTHAE